MAKKETDEIPDLFDDLPEETPQEQIARIARRNWREHLAGVRALDRRIERLIDQAVKQTLAKGRKLTADDIDGLFRKHPELRAALDRQMEQLNSDLTAVIEQGSKEAWLRANTAADETVTAMAANNPKLKELLESGQSKPQNDRALRAFRQREMQGMKLSDRVWKATEGMKLDMERAIEVALAEGVPADKLSQRVRGLLKEPHRLYRRVRDKNGNLRLSQAAQKYHPGTGVYRSSYKNAMRVARTEVNMAYQASDSERWKSSWWVKGIRVSLSNNHTCLDSKGKPAPLTDICDALAGDYPADFKFTGWHPQCRCFATAITCDYADIRDYYRRKRAGEDMTDYTPPGTITEPPEQFSKWVAANSDRLERAEKRGTTPYFIANNAKYTDPNWKPGKEKSIAISVIDDHTPDTEAKNAGLIKTCQTKATEEYAKRVEEVANIIINNGYHSSREAQIPPLNIGIVSPFIIEYARKNKIHLYSQDLYMTTKNIEHTLRESKVSKGINVTVDELTDFIKNRNVYAIYYDSAMGDFIFATDKAKFIVRPNFKIKINKKKILVFNFISATRIIGNLRDNVSGYIKIKDAKQ